MIKNNNKTGRNQSYTSGIVNVYLVEDTSGGGMPQETPTHKVKLRYKERTVGLKRYYSALQNNVEIKKLIRCQRVNSVSTQDIAVLDNGEQYAITQIQYPEDFQPAVMDLTLVEVAQKYDIT